jgi:hypothetical protein
MATSAESRIQDGTIEGLFQFLDWSVSSGYASSASAAPLKSAARQVTVVVERTKDISDIDVRGMDVNDYLARFQTLAMGDLKVESIDAYKRRFTRAVEAYRTFLETGKRPSFRTRSGGRASTAGADGRKPVATARAQQGREQVAPDTPAPPAPSSDPMIDYPFPLRNGQVAVLRLPVRFEKTDAERLAAFVRTLVLDPIKELERGRDKEDEN